MPDMPARTHDLIRLRGPAPLTADGPVPSWVEAALTQCPWVVVRRGVVRAGMIPVGVRGGTRARRFAALLASGEVADLLSPEDLPGRVIEPGRSGRVPALAALARVAPILERQGRCWGPGGSVGFELATGVATASASSDLDLIVRLDRRLGAGEAIDLRAALAVASAPARVDVMLETPRGGALLADLAAMPGRVLVRTPDGARLLADPWTPDADADAPREWEAVS
jgi:phosphoribosyl-dephospho-CoA transferase